mgnify:CR=1 FL=1
MKIAVPKETRLGERRVALVPESCKKLVQAGFSVAVEAGAGATAWTSSSPASKCVVTLPSLPMRSSLPSLPLPAHKVPSAPACSASQMAEVSG